MNWRSSALLALCGLLAVARSAAQEVPLLLKETLSREVSVFVGAEPDPPFREVISREVSLFIGAEPEPPYREAVSREISLVVTTPQAPARITQLVVSATPAGETATLSWTSYNELAEHDVARYDIYLSTRPFTNVVGMIRYASVPAETLGITLTNLPLWEDHFFAVVAVDALGGFDPVVQYAATYPLAREVVSREFSVFVGAEPEPPYREVVSREVSLVVTTPEAPARVTQLVVTPTPTGETTTLSWAGYNQWAERDVARYDIYLSTQAFTNISNMTRYATVAGETFTVTFTNLPPWQDRFYAVVPVDAAGNSDPVVNYAAGYIIAREVVSREFSVFVGAEPEPPLREVVSREVSVVISTPEIPAPVTGVNSGFAANSSTTAYGAIDLAWPSYNEVGQADVVRYRVYVALAFFDDVSQMKPYETIPAERSTWTITGLQPQGIYHLAVVAEDVLGQWNPVVYSRSARASAAAPGMPEIQTPPTSMTVALGQPVNWSVTVSGAMPLFFQWRLNGENIPDATNTAYAIPSFQFEDAGAYTVVVANAYGSVESEPAILSPSGIPVVQLVDSFADRHTFRDAEFTGMTNNLSATFESGEPKHAGKVGGKSMWLTWKPTASGVATFSTAGSSFDTLLAVYTNQVLNALGPVVSDDDRGGFLTSAVQFNAVADTEYQIAVDGHAGSSGTILLSWKLVANAPPLPQITASPVGQVALEGEAVQLTVVSPTAGVSYRWYRNGQELAGETLATLAFVATPDRVGTYRARVTSGDGQAWVESADALVEVVPRGLVAVPGEQLSADKWEDLFGDEAGRVQLQGRRRVRLQGFTSISLGVGGRYTDLSEITRSLKDPTACGGVSGASRWFRFQVDSTRAVEFAVTNSEVALTLGVYEVLGNASVGRTLKSWGCAVGGTQTSPARVEVWASRGVDYLAMVSGAGSGRLLLTWDGSEAALLREPGIGMQGGRAVIEWLVPRGRYEFRVGGDLAQWQTLFQTNMTSVLFRYEDPELADRPARFYDLRALPGGP